MLLFLKESITYIIISDIIIIYVLTYAGPSYPDNAERDTNLSSDQMGNESAKG